jgi:hypothetical protein
MKNRNRNPLKSRKAVQRYGGIQHPPQAKTNVRFGHRFRFSVPATGYSGNITAAQVLATFGTICTVTNTTVSPQAQSFRIRRIKAWASPQSQGASATVALSWFGSGNSPNLEVSDTTLSVSENACINTSPPPESLASFWQTGVGTTLFRITLPVGAILDIHADIILNDGETKGSYTVATGVLASTYYLALDHSVSDLIIPVSLQTTV